jgi:hypothetical protein
MVEISGKRRENPGSDHDLATLSKSLGGSDVALFVRSHRQWEMITGSLKGCPRRKNILELLLREPNLLDFIGSGEGLNNAFSSYATEALKKELESFQWHLQPVSCGRDEEPSLLFCVRENPGFSDHDHSLISSFCRLISLETFSDKETRSMSMHLLRGSLRELANLKRAMDVSTILAITDHRGVITHVNQRFCDVSGYTEEELIGKTHCIVNSGHHSAEFWKDFWDTISGGNVWSGVIQNRTKCGELYWVSSTIVPFKSGSGQIVQYIALRSEVTELVLARESLQQEQAELQHTYKELQTAHINLERSQKFAGIGQLAAGIAHDFNNSLSIILMGLELCLEDLRNQDFLVTTLDRVRNTVVESVSLTRRLLALGAKQPQKLIPVSLEVILLRSVDLLRPRLASIGVEIDFEIEEGMSSFLADGPAIEDALRNLVLNSLLAIEESLIVKTCSKIPSPFIKISGRIHNQEVLISVEDNGPGIQPEIREQIFEPFFTTRAREGSLKGTGLGLSMVESIVLRHGGSVDLQSCVVEEAKQPGTIITLRLPFRECPAKVGKHSRELDFVEQAVDGQIWIVDDEKYFLQLVRTALSKFGYSEVRCFSNSSELVDCLEAGTLPHLIICDLEMPFPDGFEIQKRIANMEPSNRPEFLAMTGKPNIENLNRLGVKSEEEILVKPIKLSALRKRVGKILNGKSK